MWQLVINGPGYFDTKYDLPEGTTHVGRADENDIVLSGDLVSRKHSRFHVTGGVLVFEDLGSRNGSRLNGDKVTGSTPMKAGDVVAVGENSMVVRQPTTAETAATEMVDSGGGGAVRRFGRGVDVSHAVLMARDIQDSIVRRVLDNSVPFLIEPEPPPLPEKVKRKQSDTDESEPHTAEVRVSDGPSYPVAVHSLAMLFRIAERLATAPSLQSFLDDTTDTVMKRVGASTGVVLVRHASGVLVPAAVRHAKKLQQGEVPVSDAIVDAALTQGQAIAVADVRDDARFADRESVVLYGIDQVICVPIGQDAPFDGVLYLNRTQVNDEPIEALLDVCTALSQLLQTAIHKFSSRQGPADRLRLSLERFHGPDVVERQVRVLGEKGRLAQLEEKTVTVLFAELAGFPEYVQAATPERVADLLSEWSRLTTPLLFSFDGTLEKLNGEAFTSLFGLPLSRGDDAIRAVRAAMALKAEWERAMVRRPEADRLPLRAGLHTGKVLAGTIGNELRLDYTAIGEPAQMAAWLAGSGQPGQVLITGKTLAAVGARFDVTPLGERPLLGSRIRTAVFEVLDEDDDSGTLSGVR